jgi:DNA-binding transcriptional MocR family regulator
MKSISIQLSVDSETPLYLQLADSLRREIRSGEYPDGERLPSIRRLADGAGVNPATAVSAYRILEKEGWVEARAGSGVYARSEGGSPGGGGSRGGAGTERAAGPGAFGIGADAALGDLSAGKVVVPPGVLDMAAGAPSPDLFPTAEFKDLMNEVLDRDGGWAFGYQESAGWPPFREAIAEYLRSAHGLKADSSDIRVVSGAQQGIDLAAKALLGPRDSVAVEGPTYRGALAVFWSRGAETLPVPVGADGMDIGTLERVVREKRPRLVYVIPRYQNPTTVCWSAESMRGLLDLASSHDFYVLEDDLLSDLSYGPRAEPTCLKAMDEDDRVIYVRGFSKVLMPGLRLGAVLAPRALRDRFEAAKRATDISTDGLTQRALDLYLRRGLHRNQLDRLRTHYGRVYAAAGRAAAELAPLGVRFSPPEGGLHLWLSLPPAVTGTALRAACLARSCAVVPEAVYSAARTATAAGGEAGADSHIRVSFAALTAEEAARGIRLIGGALADLGRPGGERPLL